MAARLEPAPAVRIPDLVDLRQLSSRHLENLLEEETLEWQESLDWDFRKSGDLVRRFVDLRALSGCALMDRGEAVGYSYFVLEEHKGLIGDLYVRREFRIVESENRLLGAVLEALVTGSQVHRVESQLMMIVQDPGRQVPGAEFLNTYARNFMLLDSSSAPPLADKPARHRVHLEKWSEHHQENAAQLIAAAYVGHIDSRINDQYRSVAGARRFLFNIVQYPGCGSFFRPASYVAFDLDRGWLCGLSLTSIVGPDAGHITQICVAPQVRGTGVAYELLRRSLMTLREHGATKVSLTVTAANEDAVRLYERMGFRTLRKFLAYVWEGFGRG
ncbi:MAG TPA: GNAT family N-acetyltransferase [Bryobacteraceae bacterium]|nr:GNAT family N-acetyltransferase [Bryobacteraceae bacterium]